MADVEYCCKMREKFIVGLVDRPDRPSSRMKTASTSVSQASLDPIFSMDHRPSHPESAKPMSIDLKVYDNGDHTTNGR